MEFACFPTSILIGTSGLLNTLHCPGMCICSFGMGMVEKGLQNHSAYVVNKLFANKKLLKSKRTQSQDDD